MEIISLIQHRPKNYGSGLRPRNLRNVAGNVDFLLGILLSLLLLLSFSHGLAAAAAAFPLRNAVVEGFLPVVVPMHVHQQPHDGVDVQHAAHPRLAAVLLERKLANLHAVRERPRLALRLVELELAIDLEPTKW